MREAHDAALDEPLRDPDRRDAAHLGGRRQRGDDVDRRYPLLGSAHRAAGADVSLFAALVLHLLLSDRARDARARKALRGEVMLTSHCHPGRAQREPGSITTARTISLRLCLWIPG